MSKHKDIKELKHFSIGGNVLHPDEGVSLSLFNYDKNDNEIDTVAIKLDPSRVRVIFNFLKDFIVEE